MKIKTQIINPKCRFEKTNKGEWIDLRASHNFIKNKVDSLDLHLISLGVAMQLPKGFEALIIPRSSTFKNFKILQANGCGLIDSSYCGCKDIWKFPAIVTAPTNIAEGDRICQFRIQPSQFASVWTKIKWIFTRKIKFEEVKLLDYSSRGGFGSTGIE